MATLPHAATSPANPQTTTKTGAEVFLDVLVNQKVEKIFGYPGGVILNIYKLLPKYDIEHILVRHEQGATHIRIGTALFGDRKKWLLQHASLLILQKT